MPKMKPTPVQQNSETIRNNITLLAASNGLRTDREIAARIGMGASTYCKHRNNPRLWTVEQLVLVAIAFKSSLAWIVTPHNITEEVIK